MEIPRLDRPHSAALFDLRRPCDTCPFRTDKLFFLRTSKAERIAAALDRGRSFHCHNTIDYEAHEREIDAGAFVPDGSEALCAGAMIVLLKNGQRTQLMQLHERIRRVDLREWLDMDAPVFDDFDHWLETLEAAGEGERSG